MRPTGTIAALKGHPNAVVVVWHFRAQAAVHSTRRVRHCTRLRIFWKCMAAPWAGSWRDLAPAIGSRARVAGVLNKRRALTLPMIGALGPLLDPPADVLVQAYRCSVSPTGRASPAARARGSGRNLGRTVPA
ncbi:MAG TPA: hypothetical protein VGG99_23370 [Acetobacteraceae bacterium]|jgi:hypothetical protein